MQEVQLCVELPIAGDGGDDASEGIEVAEVDDFAGRVGVAQGPRRSKPQGTRRRVSEGRFRARMAVACGQKQAAQGSWGSATELGGEEFAAVEGDASAPVEDSAIDLRGSRRQDKED